MGGSIRTVYGDLDRIAQQLRKYSAALDTIKRVVDENRETIAQQKGESIIALEKARLRLLLHVFRVKSYVDALQNIFVAYIQATEAYIRPQYRAKAMIVDEEGIGRGIARMGQDINSLHADALWGFTYFLPPEPEPWQVEEYYRQLRNMAKVQAMASMIPAAKPSVLEAFHRTQDIHKNSVVPFAMQDEEFGHRASRLYDEHKQQAEKLFTNFAAALKTVASLKEGFDDGIIDSAKGIGGLYVDLSKLQAAGLVWVLSKIEDMETPKWADSTLANLGGGAAQLIKDPLMLLRAMAQDLQETYERRGLAYTTGRVAFDALMTLLPFGAISKVGKAGSASRLVKGADKALDAKAGAKPLPGIDGAVDATKKAEGVKAVKAPNKLRDKVWELDPKKRGAAIEDDLARTEYKKWDHKGAEGRGFFPVVDFVNWKTKTVVSLKTIDPRLPSYSKGKATEKIKKYVDALNRDIKLGNPNIPPGKVPAVRVLDVRVPKGTKKLLDIKILTDHARDNKIIIEIKEY